MADTRSTSPNEPHSGSRLDPALEREVREAMDAVNGVLREARQRSQARRAEREALARQLHSFAAQGRALCVRWEIVQARREGRLFDQAGAS